MGSYRKKVRSFEQASANFASIDAYVRKLNTMLKAWRKSGVDDLFKTDTRRLKKAFKRSGPGPGGGVTGTGGPPKWP